MSYFVVDCESDGPYPIDYSLVCFAAIRVDPKLDCTFYGKTKPISDNFISSALAISGFTREQHLTFNDPASVIRDFSDWVVGNSKGRPIFISDNPAYDWQWINTYTHMYTGSNPFGWSGRRIGDLFCGLQKNAYANWKKLRKTKHDHDPLNDARGNAEALLEMAKDIKGLD